MSFYKFKFLARAIILIIFSGLFSNLCDISSKYLSFSVNIYQIVFLRYFFSFFILLSIYIFFFKKKVSINFSKIGNSRSILLFIAILLWCYGLKYVSIPIATTIAFTSPIIALILSKFFLSENVNLKDITIIICCFLGIILMFNPFGHEINKYLVLMVLSATLFGIVDCMNKNITSKESSYSSIFNISFWISSFSLLPAIYYWDQMTLSSVILSFLLGILNILVIYTLLESYKLLKLKSVLPWKYTEIFFSLYFSYLLFNESVKYLEIIGIILIIGSNLIGLLFFKKNGEKSIALLSN